MPNHLRRLFARSRGNSINRQTREGPLSNASTSTATTDSILRPQDLPSSKHAGTDVSTTAPATELPLLSKNPLPLNPETENLLGDKVDLWDEAYNKLKREQANLFEQYKHCIVASGDESATPSLLKLDSLESEQREKYLAMQIEKRLHTIQKQEWSTAADVYKKIVKTVLFAKDFVAQAASNEPHAALAWAGVSMLLPLLLKPDAQRQAATEGLAIVSDLMLKYRVIEKSFRSRSGQLQARANPAETDLIIDSQRKIMSLYSQILDFQIRMAYYYSRHGLNRYMRDLVTSDDWGGMQTSIDASHKAIQENLDIIGHVHLDNALEAQQSRFQEFSEQSMPILNSLNSKLDKSRDDQLLKTISHVGDAAYNSYENQWRRQCLADTRVDLLRDITNWATGNSNQYIFWLRGRAGTGKSTIAFTIAQSLDRPGISLASFFFKRGGGDLARSRKVVSTIAFQLAIRSRLLGNFICEALQEDPTLADSASLSQQYNKLLLGPLQRLQRSATDLPLSVILLDAIDECDDFDDVSLLLRLLGDTQKLAGLGLRVLVTSRPEVLIRLGFHKMEHIAYQELALHDVDRAIVDQDIKRFVTYELAQIRADRNLPDCWPGDDKIRTITAHADGLFIYAATVCRYVNSPRLVSATVRLEQVCQASGTKHQSTKALDEMYLIVLESSMKGDFSAEEIQEVTTRLRYVVGSIVLLFENLSAVEIARLLFPTLPTGGAMVQDTLESLHAVLDIPQHLDKPIQTLHLSFRDFLVDKNRCPNIWFQINQQQVHQELFNRCLDLMQQSLVHNICRLARPGILVNEVSEATLRQYLPFGSRYACRHWVSHAKYGRLSFSDNGTVHIFLRRCYLYWVEVMSLIGKIPEAIIMMTELESLTDIKKAPELRLLVQDILRFSLSFSHMVSKAPLQLYSAGLLFSPINSVVRRFFSSQTSTDLEIKTQLLLEWNTCTQTLEGHLGWVASVVFSPDGSQLASGSEDSTVRVWDVQTGQCQHTLEGHSSWVTSVVFSPDGSRVASGSEDNTVRVWDVQTGQCQHTLEGHSGPVASVVFSPDGSRVASGSHDSTVRVWDVQTGQCQYNLEGHSGLVVSVVFSPDGSQVASGSHDSTVRVWDVKTGQCQHTLEGHSGLVTSVVFSPDGSRVASSSWDSTVRVWDVQTGQCQHTLERRSGWVASVVFSPDGSQVASGSSDSMVRVWDVQTGQCQHTLEGHSHPVVSVVFSPDGSRVASGSEDSTVRVWDMQTGQCQHTLEGHSRSVFSVVFSPDGSQMASGSEDSTVRVWDVQAAQCEHTLEGHSGRVASVVFSPDGSQVASSSHDSTVRMWDVQTGQCQHTLEGHSRSVNSVVFSPDGSQVASGSHDSTVRVWDVRTGQCQHKLEFHSRPVNSVVFSPNGSRVASGSQDSTVRVWDVQTGQCQHTLKDHSGSVVSVVFSPDGSRVASGSQDSTVRVWDVQTGQCQHTLESHESWVASVVFSPDGSRVASGSGDKTVRVWDVTNSIELMCYKTEVYTHDIEFSDDSMKVIVDGDVLSISSPTRFGGIAARTPMPAPYLPTNKLRIEGDWVTLSSQRILWLPPEYRPGGWASKGDIIAIGSGTGRVTFIGYAATHSSLI